MVNFNVVRQLYEGLLDYDHPRTLEVVPRVAESWSVSDSGWVWAFVLHPGVRFVDDPCSLAGAKR